nr:hypothetical protein [Pandoravirus aubagnensis]
MRAIATTPATDWRTPTPHLFNTMDTNDAQRSVVCASHSSGSLTALVQPKGVAASTCIWNPRPHRGCGMKWTYSLISIGRLVAFSSRHQCPLGHCHQHHQQHQQQHHFHRRYQRTTRRNWHGWDRRRWRQMPSQEQCLWLARASGVLLLP